MIRDRYFYPLSAIVVAAMIWIALSFSQSPRLSIDEIRLEGFVTTGEDLVTLTASPGTNYSYIARTNISPAHVVMWTDVPRADATPSAGVFASLAPQFETAFAGQTLRLTVRARKGRRSPLTTFDAGYYTGEGGNSGWKPFRLTSTFQDYSFDYAVPERGEDAEPDLDYFGIWPGSSGDQRTMEVSRLEIEVLSTPGQLRR